jgi:hypothetical protein
MTTMTTTCLEGRAFEFDARLPTGVRQSFQAKGLHYKTLGHENASFCKSAMRYANAYIKPIMQDVPGPEHIIHMSQGHEVCTFDR